MLKRTLECLVTIGVFSLIVSCSSVGEYERHVKSWEPVYCYKSIGRVQCHNKPKHSDERRLVNYYGPAPHTYEASDALVKSKTKAPKMIQTWVKDKEPVAQASPPSSSALVSVVTAVKASGSALQEEEKTSLIDRLMRFIHGEPKLANGPPT